MSIEKNVVKFDVSMKNTLLVDVNQTFDDLFEDKFGVVLLQSSSLPHIIQKITSSTDLHDENDMSLQFECLV